MRRFRGRPIESTVLDRAIDYFAPIRGARRRQARMFLALSGGYVGARKDRRATKEWATTSGSADADLLPDLGTLRDRSRDAERNLPIGSGILSSTVTNTVGTGLEPQPSVDREALAAIGISDQQAADFEGRALLEWRLWADSPDCDATRTQPFVGLQDLAFRSMLASGDVFCARRYIPRPSSPYGLAVQMIEADRVSNPWGLQDQARLEGTGNMVSGGVELDENGAPVAYHLQRQHPGDLRVTAREWDRVLAFGPSSGERIVFHLFRRKRPHQTRGIPYLAPVIESLKQLGRYSEAELMAAVISSFFTVFVTTPTGDGYQAQATSDSPGVSSDDDELKLGMGAVAELAPGEKIETANPGRPNSQFDPFYQSVVGQIGVGLELPVEIVLKQFSSSYSASRGAILEAWKLFRVWRAFISGDFCQPFYDALIGEAIALGRLSAPGFFQDPLVRRAWLGADWIGPPQGQLDPESEAAAAEKWIDLGVKTKGEVTAEVTGGDWKSKIAQRGREEEARRAAGVDSPEAPGSAAPGASAPPRSTPARQARLGGAG